MKYKIKSGDTLSQIAKKEGITLRALLAANPSIKNANKIQAGQSITIPKKTKQTESSNPYKKMTKTQMSLLDKKNKSEKAQRTATRSSQAQERNAGNRTTGNKDPRGERAELERKKARAKKAYDAKPKAPPRKPSSAVDGANRVAKKDNAARKAKIEKMKQVKEKKQQKKKKSLISMSDYGPMA